MNPKAAEKSLNSNTRCKFPFTTLHPLSFFNSAAISCSESFAAAIMKTSRLPDKLPSSFGIIRHQNNREQARNFDLGRAGFSLSILCGPSKTQTRQAEALGERRHEPFTDPWPRPNDARNYSCHSRLHDSGASQGQGGQKTRDPWALAA